MFRFLSWFGIGLSLYYLGDKNPVLTLWFVGIGLFLFSFVAGFGTVLFHELLGKIFTNNFRGVTWAYRQFFMGVGGILSAFFTAYLFHRFEDQKTLSFALAFIISSGFMAIGYIFLGLVKEDAKINVVKKESNFWLFLKKSFSILFEDKKLSNQIIVCLFSYTYLLVFPFIVKYARLEISFAGLALGSALPLLVGNVLGNIIWVKLSKTGNDKLIIQLSFLAILFSLIMAIFADHMIMFIMVFFLAGIARDGFRLSFKNMVLSIAPEDKRPVYFAVHNNLTSFGMFFSIPGGWLLNHYSINSIIILTVFLLFFGFILSFRLTSNHS